ncbi:unnamed protein product [Periconia digitata]|uniref:Histidine kinase n=1 Tax=Periconia digitata TaxID=1303443 RepID=A0A9W4UBB6_9PLEO|nr:unnamed protein product [Periconia digitata]
MAATETAPHDYFDLQDMDDSPSLSNGCEDMSIAMPSTPSPTTAALTALQYLPIPMLVLSDQKTVVLANEAMGRLLGIEFECTATDGITVSDALEGKGMADLGVDILQNGSPLLVSWEDFLDSLLQDSSSGLVHLGDGLDGSSQSGGTTPTATETPPKLPRLSSSNLTRTVVRDISVDVVILPYSRDGGRCPPGQSKPFVGDDALQATLIISVWSIENTQYFTLTFTSAQPAESPHNSRPSSRFVTRTATSFNLSKSHSSTSSSSGRRSGSHSNGASKVASPNTAPVDFPPRGPPLKAKNDLSITASIFQKASQMKDAILNSINMPAYAMWKDESFGLPNKALLQFITNEETYNPSDQRAFLSQFTIYTEDFSRELDVDEFPVMKIVRSQKQASRRLGMSHPVTGINHVFDVVGEPVLHNTTGEFLGGIVVFKDVTEYTNKIAAQVEKNERQFEYIANFIPILIWTTTPEGAHDWYSQRWYDYTGQTVEQSLGEGWRDAFHPEDLPATTERWLRSLATGEEYNTEYRARRHDGTWRWMLGRAVPFYDDDGKILKWFGTCTDIHDLVEARQAARQTKAQLLRVIEHAKVTLWAVDRQKEITLLEGIRPGLASHNAIGRNIFEYFGDMERWRKSIDGMLMGEGQNELIEKFVEDGRYYRTRLVPMWSRSRVGGVDGENYIDGVIGVSMDVTELRQREMQLKQQEEENSKLVANAVAAKEASRMKSQFLANMSHEIRTPIAGVIGMSELMLDMDLDAEQRECAENIQRSANGLLTVINDILDFSKVESGRLDVEEVQFSLSVVLRDVNKMMSFAAQRKNIAYESFIQAEVERDLRVMGDPGRLRQILTNLLTNSIKFTGEGHVHLKVSVTEETKDTVTVCFVVKDSGIGIEEEVRKRLFRPFSQADSSTARRYGGTGLGLTISKNLVELMRGTISLESKLGYGTVATFSIPFNRAPYPNGNSPLIDLASIPDRLQSDVSVSCSSSADHTPPLTPKYSNGSTVLGSGRGEAQPLHMSPSLNASIPDHLMSLPESERKHIHILVVEDNQINQQIALKTIRKLHFSVNAVWNGQEVLDYLSQKPSPSRPRPNIILMDVQMPIRDGYSATQAIRTEFDQVPEVRNVPIIAMTASAIQGDREKCQQAGMDDYLSKPVKGKLLEKMLVKWAVEGSRRKVRAKAQAAANERDRRGGAPTDDAGPSATAQNPPDHLPQIAQPLKSETAASPALTAELDRLHYQNDTALAKSSETDVDRALRRIHAEEMASTLRDDKLLSLTGAELALLSDRDSVPKLPLTQENMQKLEKAAEPVANRQSRQANDDRVSNAPEPRSRSDSITRSSTQVRPSLMDTRLRDSQQTVLARSPTST